MSILILNLLLALCLPAFASAQERPSLKLPSLLYAGAAMGDIWSTADCLSVGCHETNPAINWLTPQGTGPMLAFGVAVEAAGYATVRRYVAPTHPKVAKWGIYGAAATHFALMLRNVQQAKAQRAWNARIVGGRP